MENITIFGLTMTLMIFSITACDQTNNDISDDMSVEKHEDYGQNYLNEDQMKLERDVLDKEGESLKR